MTFDKALHAAVRDNRSFGRTGGDSLMARTVRRFADDGSYVRSEIVDANGDVYQLTKDDQEAADWEVR